MSKYAYRDEKRKNIIYSTDAVKEDRDKVFFCPNPNCTAQLYICAVDGSRSAYFSATKDKFQHTSNCPFGSSKMNFNENEYDQTQFVFDVAMDSLCTANESRNNSNTQTKHNEGEAKKHPPRTLRQIYSMCKNYPVEYKYGNKEIGEMLLDDRSESKYQSKWTGNRIIEAMPKGWFYDKERKQIYLVSPIGNQKCSFTLSFSDDKIYYDIQSEIYNNKDKTIVVAGNWAISGTDDCHVTVIKSKKQVLVIKK